MYFKVKKCEAVLSKRSDGKTDIRITMVWLYTNDGKWIKWVKLDEFMELLPECTIAHPASFYPMDDALTVS